MWDAGLGIERITRSVLRDSFARSLAEAGAATSPLVGATSSDGYRRHLPPTRVADWLAWA